MLYQYVICLFILISSSTEYQTNTQRLDSILTALYKSLLYMKTHISEINLDAVFGARLVEGQLEAYLKFEPRVFKKIRPQLNVLLDLASNVADEGRINVIKNDKEYAESIGRAMDRFERLLWFPSRRTNRDFVETPVPCSESFFNETKSDLCFKQVLGSGSEPEGFCPLTEDCKAINTAPKQRGYVITHQVLFLQFLEMRNCSKLVPPHMMVYLCSNVMRDALEIEEARFPLNHQDLFMEQIGLCGISGFEDFYKHHWIDEILAWQQPSGCFGQRAKWHCSDDLIHSKTREKRREMLLEDGCLSHKTSVASLALAVSVRFEAERLFNEV